MWGTGILKGFAITMRNMLRPTITVQYPEQRLELPERARWRVTQKFTEDGAPKCTACLICERECPDYVLRIDWEQLTRSGADGAEEKYKRIHKYVYEVGACMMCGLCVESCVFDAIEMSHDYELARIDPSLLSIELLTDADAAAPKRKAAAAAAQAPAPAPAPEKEPAAEPAANDADKLAAAAPDVVEAAPDATPEQGGE